MALCELCHWAFDEGMMGVTLSGRGIIPPADRDLWPARKYLAEHRRGWRL